MTEVCDITHQWSRSSPKAQWTWWSLQGQLEEKRKIRLQQLQTSCHCVCVFSQMS